MNDAPSKPELPRRSFLEAPPQTSFLKSPEGKRLLFFGLLFAVAGVLLYFQYKRTEARIELAAAERGAAEAAAKSAIPEAELLAKKRALLPTLFEGALIDAADGEDFQETAGYHTLLEMLAGYTPAEVTQKAVDPLDRATALREPDLSRGEFVRVRGLLAGIFAVKLARPAQGVSDVWRGSLTDTDGNEGIVFDLIGDPPPVEPQRSLVEIDGMMYRTVGYDAKRGSVPKLAPYVLARNLRVIDPAPPSGSSTKYLVIGLGIAVIIAYLMLRSSMKTKRRQAPQKARFKEMFEQRRRAERAEPRP
ncbi:MAG TPA: hypothetical protein VK843_06220 [Planctomycetota bacterium]|nr:hypothetical protein [Planctomycetota bacterium]